MSLFNRYDKEGPGVRKDAPKKKTFFLFFEVLFRYFWKLIGVNMLYWLLSILPFGFSAVGMTHVARSLSRGKHSFFFSDFFSAIKKNFKQALGIGFLNSVLTYLLLIAIYFYFKLAVSGNTMGIIVLGISVFILLYFTVMKFYIWFMVITFNFKTGQIYKNSFKFVIINLKNNAVMLFGIGVFWAIILGLLMIYPTLLMQTVLTAIVCFFYPSYYYIMVCFGIFESIKKCIIDPYYNEHPDDDIEFRRNLGLDVGDEEESDFMD